MSLKPSSTESKPPLSGLRETAAAMLKMRQRIDELENAAHEPIAVIGMGCRVPPDIHTTDDFWDFLINGGSAIREIPADRWPVDKYYDESRDSKGTMYTKHGGYLDRIDQFDPRAFGITPREAISMDPQQRIMLEVSWEAFENAGYFGNSLKGSKTGVYVGICSHDYSFHTLFARDKTQIDAYSATGISFSVSAGRISYLMDLKGPALALDTACSSSLVAIHCAVKSLRHRECDLALAGGVATQTRPVTSICFSKMGALAPDGKCKSFDARADGYGRGEGAGAVVLKRLRDAQRDGDHIHAVIRGIAMNHDGQSGGLTVPNSLSQETLLTDALQDARCEADRVNMVEAHGTGTPLGDPIEVHAIKRAYAESREPDQPLYITSAKSNVGHLEGGAGVIGFIKLVLSLRNKKVSPIVGFETLNPNISLEAAPIVFPAEQTSLPKQESPLMGGVSSFGFSGTNAHILVEEVKNGTFDSTEPTPYQIFPLSALEPKALEGIADRYSKALAGKEAEFLADAAYTAAIGRRHFSNRLAIVGANEAEVQKGLAAAAKSQSSASQPSGGIETNKRTKTAFLFTGQGSQYAGMGQNLLPYCPQFKAALAECSAVASQILDISLEDLLWGSDAADAALLDQTKYTQPALFALEYALAKQWIAWGITPESLLGHSVGEYAAACIGNVFSLEDGLRLICERARLMQSLPSGGAMAAVFADSATARKGIEPWTDNLHVAAENSPKNTVISGDEAAMERALEQFTNDGISAQRLTVSHAFHSHLMDPILESFRAAASKITYRDPEITLISNLTGRPVQKGEIDADYWTRHLRASVKCHTGLKTLIERKCMVAIEVGPAGTLASFGRHCGANPGPLWVTSMRRDKHEYHQLLNAVGDVYCRGASIDWQMFYDSQKRRRVELPTYAFSRERLWVPALDDTGQSLGVAETLHPLIHSCAESGPDAIVYNSQFSAASPAFLNDHVVQGVPVFPATAYWEMAMAAANASNLQPTGIADVSIEAPLALDENSETETAIRLIKDGAENTRFEIVSWPDPNTTETETRHAAGQLLSGDRDSSAHPAELATLKERCHQEKSVTEVYQTMRHHGMDYGPCFQGIKTLHLGKNESLAWIAPADDLQDNGTQYQLHPALWDACLQSLGACIESTNSEEAFLPVGLDRLDLIAPIATGKGFWCHAELDNKASKSSETIRGNISLLTEEESVAARIEGVRLRPTHRLAILRMLGKSPETRLYEMAWRKRALEDLDGSNSEGRWLVFANGSSHSEAAVKLLKTKNLPFTRVDAEAGDGPLGLSSKGKALELLKQHNPNGIRGILFFWAIHPESHTPLSPTRLKEQQELLSTATLHLAQALAELDSHVPAFFLTAGAQSIGSFDEITSPDASPLWGLIRSLSNEQPGLSVKLVDLPVVNPAEEVQSLLKLIARDAPGLQWAIRGTDFYQARLARHAGAQGQLGRPDAEAYHLGFTERGLIDNLRLLPLKSSTPRKGEIKIRVRSTGLNFRDVLNVLDMYPGDPGALGGECAGVVVETGDSQSGFSEGQRVVAIAPGSFASEVIIPETLAAPLPARVSYDQGASIPITFLTAHYALNHLGKMKKGDRVLIHAATGGVGMAAVQLAQQAGAEIFATAGSDAKRNLLKSAGIQHIGDSRSVGFKEYIDDVTENQGLDLVLNSLAGEFIDEGLSLLKQGGSFLEIGKLGLRKPEDVAQSHPGIHYLPIALDDLSQNQPQLISQMFDELMPRFEGGELQPLPVTPCPIEKAPAAFRYMQQARHTGKVIITHPTPVTEQVYETGTYLISGGNGALGRLVANRFIELGALSLMLLGRRPPSDDLRSFIDDAKKNGVHIHYVECDIAASDAASVIKDRLSQLELPLKGIVHAAGALDDAMFHDLTSERIDRVMAPKVAGTWQLHELSLKLNPEFFLLFSSASAVMGAQGQANYAAANAFMDAFAHYRRSLGFTAQSLNWGPWAEGGMAASDTIDESRWEMLGIRPFQPKDGILVMEHCMGVCDPQLLAIDATWERFVSRNGAGEIAAFLEEVSAGTATSSTSGLSARLHETLADVPTNQQRDVVGEFVREQVAQVLGMPTDSDIDDAHPLKDMGLDSMMAVELANALSSAAKKKLPATILFDYPNCESLADHLYADVLKLDAGEKEPEPSAPEVTQESPTDTEVSLDDLEASLERELKDVGY